MLNNNNHTQRPCEKIVIKVSTLIIIIIYNNSNSHNVNSLIVYCTNEHPLITSQILNYFSFRSQIDSHFTPLIFST